MMHLIYVVFQKLAEISGFGGIDDGRVEGIFLAVNEVPNTDDAILQQLEFVRTLHATHTYA